MKLENPEEGRFTFFSGKGRILHRERPQTQLYAVETHVLSFIFFWFFTLKAENTSNMYQGTLNAIHMIIRAKFVKIKSNITMQGHLGSRV